MQDPRSVSPTPISMSAKVEGTTRKISIFTTPEEVARAGAEIIVVQAMKAIADRGVFSVALSGGTAPKRIYQLLATPRFQAEINWSKVHLFFGDERCVPPESEDSNYRMVAEALISKIPIPASNVHRIRGEIEATEGARIYELELRDFFAGEWPQFDLVFLGMGADGHTASLFPGTAALSEKSRWVVATRMDKLAQDRITLTIPVFNHAAQVVFVVTGAEKAERLAEVLNGEVRPTRLPVDYIQPAGALEWLIDEAAAAKLLAADIAEQPEDDDKNQDC